MTETLLPILLFTLIPITALSLGHGLALLQDPGPRTISLFQHFAAGMVFSAVALELLPALRHTDRPGFMASGFLCGVGAMLALDRAAEKAG